MTPFYQDKLTVIYHGDSRSVISIIPDCSVDIIFTDPPYGKNIEESLIAKREVILGQTKQSHGARKVAGDGESEELADWLMQMAARKLRTACCCCGGGPDPMFARWSLLMELVLNWTSSIVNTQPASYRRSCYD